MSIPIRSGKGQSDSINRLIQLTVIQLSGGYCILSIVCPMLSRITKKWPQQTPGQAYRI